MCPKAFILDTFKGMRINPLKNIHFSDKVGVGGSSPLIPTRESHSNRVIFLFSEEHPPYMKQSGI